MKNLFTVIFRPLRPLRPFDFASQDMLCERNSEFRLRLCRARPFMVRPSPGFGISGDMPRAEARGNSITEIKERTDITETQKKKILGENARRFFAL